ncbi:MAG: PAS domain S-box protein [Planctomycetales bacterium]|nr:PAS domain S-box protein [Planctomycetales bacterium]
MNSSMKHILIVAHDPNDRNRIQRLLMNNPEHHYIFIETELGVVGLSMIEHNDSFPFDCVLFDESRGDITAREFLAALCADGKLPPCPVIVLSDAPPSVGASLLRTGAQDCLLRSQLTGEILSRAVLNALERHAMSTERLNAKEALRASDAKFRALLEAAPDAMVIVNQHGIIVLVNALTKRMFGYLPEELIGQHVEILMPLQMRDSHEDHRLVYSTDPHPREMSGGLELLGLRKDGSQFPIEVSLSPLETNQGVLVSSAIRDVTVRKQVEEQLRQSDAQLRFIMDSMPQKIGTTNPNGEVDYFNPQVTEFTGLSFDQLQTWGWTQFIHPDDVEGHVRAWKKSIENGEAFEFESRFRRFDGVYRWHFSRALPMRDQAGAIVMWVGSNTDIDDIKQAEAALQISEVRYRRLFEAAKDGILILDFINGRIVDANPYMSDLLGYSHESFLGKELWEIGLFKDRAANEDAVKGLQKTGYLRYEHLPLESKNGVAVEVEIVANAYREADHQVIQCNIRDITERSRLEKLLQTQSRELENLHLRKDEFLAMLSHELRSPLAPIANAVQLMSLQQETESRTQKQARNIIERQLGKLQRLVDDLLEVSRITSGRVQLRKEWVAVSGIIHGAIETVRPLIQQRRHELTISMPVVPIWLSADAARLEQVVINLLTNAAKYTEEGGEIRLTVVKDRNDCVIRVRDSGVGIAPGLLPHVFDLFTQAERSLDRSQGGLGIGLALVQRLTELHDGTVEARSEPGQGSEFIVRLPLQPDDSKRVADIEVAVLEANLALRVLVVDDNVDTVLGFSLLLKAQGHDVRTAYNGPDAVKTAAEFHPHVIMLDIGLPVLNGYEVAKQIRAQPEGEKIMLIALTGYGQDSDRRTSSDAGFDHHLVKPARFEQLLQILAMVKVSE